MFNIHIHINVSLNKNINPSCGVEDYQKTWDNFYDAANLRETYNFMASGTQVKEMKICLENFGRLHKFYLVESNFLCLGNL